MGKRRKNVSRTEFLPLVMTIYVTAVLAGMILVYHDFYYDILETKAAYYYICTLTMLALTGGWLFLTAHPVEAVRKNRGKKLFDIISPADLAVLIWGAVVILSTVCSPVGRYALTGEKGRYTGGALLILYAAAYFCITRYYRAKEWHMAIFLAAGMGMCLFGITDFFEMDLLHFKAEIKETQRHMFTSTIGNINTYTSCVAMVMACAGMMFATAGSVKKAVCYGLCTITAFTALIMGESDNAYLSLAVFFGILPLWLFASRRGVRRYLMLAASFFTAAGAVHMIQKNMASPKAIEGLFQVIAGSRFLLPFTAVLWCGAGACCLRDYRGKRENEALPRTLRTGWAFLLLLAAVGTVFVLCDVNILGNGDRYGGLKQYLFFNDDWGTHRGYVWRIAVEDYSKFPPLQKLIGFGPDTFGIVTRLNNYPEMADRYQEIFDSAHNEYLQYLVTTGPLGLLSYMAVHIGAAMEIVRKKRGDWLAAAALVAVLCYDLQAAVNINQPIAAPIMWTLLAAGAAKRT